MKREIADFYCIACGRKGIPISRDRSHLHSVHHRKRLYCPWCKTEVNHIECRSFMDVETFKDNFANGMYIEEARQSIAFVKGETVNG